MSVWCLKLATIQGFSVDKHLCGLDGCRCYLVQGLTDVTALCSRDRVAQMELWQLLPVQATVQAARVKTKEGGKGKLQTVAKEGNSEALFPRY